MVGLPRSIIKKYGVSKKAWAVFRGTKTTSRKRGKRGRNMARRRSYGGSSSPFRSIASGDLISSTFAGMGAAAFTKRFVGAPLGAMTGVGAGIAYAVVKKQNILGSAFGGFIHDNVGNVGGAAGNSGGYLQ